MIISLNEHWRINSDEKQWMLERKKGLRHSRRDGSKQENWVAQSFYTDFGLLLRTLAMRQIRLIDGKYPLDALEMLNQSLAHIENILDNAVESIAKADELRSTGTCPKEGCPYAQHRLLPPEPDYDDG